MYKKNIKNYAFLVFSLLFFISTTAFTTSQFNTYFANTSITTCYECGAYGCNSAEEGDNGGTQCTEENTDEDPTMEKCDLGGSVCEGSGDTPPGET